VIETKPTDEATNVAVCSPLVVRFDQPVESEDIAYQFEPSHAFTVVNDDEQTHRLELNECLAADTRYRLHLTLKSSPNDHLSELDFTTKAGVHVTSYAPAGDAAAVNTSVIEINFSDPMQEIETYPAIMPPLPGSWQWESPTALRYHITSDLPPDTKFAITLPKDLITEAGEHFASEVILSFKSIGLPKVKHVTPKNGGLEVARESSITLTFDQTVDHASAEAAFSLSPSMTGTWQWQGNSATYKPTSLLEADTTYTIHIQEGVIGQNKLISTDPFQSTFRTLTTTVMLSIGLDYQDKALSCEAAALKMALTGKGLHVSEDAIMQIIGFDPTLRSGDIWGDPDTAFVGSINGKQNSTGYGVHWDPIAKAARSLGRSATAFSGFSPSDLAREISQNNPVIIWGTLGRGVYDPWYTPQGKLIKAWKGEHTRTVIGFKGNVNAPTHFILNDPNAGRITWTTAQLKANWATFNNSGVVVY
jgi:uncharacterized protein YvpB